MQIYFDAHNVAVDHVIFTITKLNEDFKKLITKM